MGILDAATAAMKRGQLSILLIAAAVLVIVFGLMIMIGRMLQPSVAEQTLTVRGADANTTLCLQDATTSAIMNALRTGGVTVNDTPRQAEWGSGVSKNAAITSGTYRYTIEQFGTLPPEQLGEWRKDTIGRTAPKAYFEDPITKELILVGVQRGPDFANWKTATPGRIPASGPSRNTAWFGNLTFEPLCARTGANRPNADGTGALTCLPGTYHVANPTLLSFQTRLEESITKVVRANPEACPQTDRVTLTLGESDVVATAGNESVRVPIRLKALYNAAWNFARLEVLEQSHALVPPNGITTWRPIIAGCKAEVNNGNCLLPSMDVAVRSVVDECEVLDGSGTCTFNGNPEPPGFTQPITIVTITDRSVRFDGEYPSIRFAVRNRYPFLDSSYQSDSINQLLVPFQPPQVFGCDVSDSSVPDAQPYTLPLGVEPDDKPFVAVILHVDENGNRETVKPGALKLVDASTQPPSTVDLAQPTLHACRGSCSLELSCQGWRNTYSSIDEDETPPQTFEVVFCSQGGGTTYDAVNDLFTLPYPDGDNALSWPRNCHRATFSLDDEPSTT